MKKRCLKLSSLILVLMLLGAWGCVEGKFGKLRKTTQTTRDELRQQWTDYVVYYRPNLALLYQIKNGGKMVLPSNWVRVTTGEMMAKSTISRRTDLKEILGQNDELFGFLVFRYDDLASVTIVDEKTVRLFYEHIVVEAP